MVGANLTALGQREQVRSAAAELIEAGPSDREITRRFRVSRMSANSRRQMLMPTANGREALAFKAGGRGRSVAEAPPPALNTSDLVAADLPEAGRVSDLSAMIAVRAAGSSTFGDVIRGSARARSWHPVGDPEADREALLAG